MSMLDAFFNKGFKGAKCKTLLKLTIPRIKLLRNRREIQLKQMRRDIAKLLENGQEATARIRVEHIIREENMMAAQEIMELFCELIAVRLPIIETQRECPLDLKEAISSICFAAPRCSDLPELQQVQMLFAAKYGKEFVAAAAELMPDCGVNRQIIELLSVRAPSVDAKLKLLKEIAEEHELDWDPAASETEFLKPHEDLLNGPNHFISGSTLPLPKEKHDDSLSSNPVKESDEESDTDAGFDSLDLPEVPRVSVRASSDNPSAPEIVPPRPASPHHLEPDREVTKSSPPNKDAPHISSVEPEVDGSGPSLPYLYTPPNVSVATRENKQFIPFVSTPSLPAKQSDPPSPLSQDKSESNVDSPSVPSVSFLAKQSEPAASLFQKTSETNADSPSVPFVSFSVKQGEPAPSLSRTKSDANADLQDVLAAAHAAAESAERAAAAARAAASLAQVRITDLVSKRNDRNRDRSENEFHGKHSHQLDAAGKPTFDQQNSFGHTQQITGYEPDWSLGSPTLSSRDVPKIVAESPDSNELAPEHQSAHRPQRLTSLEDDPYFSYPNLFNKQDSNLGSGNLSSSENSRSAHEF